MHCSAELQHSVQFAADTVRPRMGSGANISLNFFAKFVQLSGSLVMGLAKQRSSSFAPGACQVEFWHCRALALPTRVTLCPLPAMTLNKLLPAWVSNRYGSGTAKSKVLSGSSSMAYKIRSASAGFRLPSRFACNMLANLPSFGTSPHRTNSLKAAMRRPAFEVQVEFVKRWCIDCTSRSSSRTVLPCRSAQLDSMSIMPKAGRPVAATCSRTHPVKPPPEAESAP
mmetsp:Transcript_49254/g.141603  ORF Transcript_49254/g.141603 Transcript_49254/m.141603 type:complete len:226 (-) Transcript_49254:656-1333(-)